MFRVEELGKRFAANSRARKKLLRYDGHDRASKNQDRSMAQRRARRFWNRRMHEIREGWDPS